MSEHPQVTCRREDLPAFARADLDAMSDCFTDDVVWHVAGSHPLSGDYRGKEALFYYFARSRGQASLELEPTGILGNDQHVATFLKVRGTRGEKSMEVEMCDMLR